MNLYTRLINLLGGITKAQHESALDAGIAALSKGLTEHDICVYEKDGQLKIVVGEENTCL